MKKQIFSIVFILGMITTTIFGQTNYEATIDESQVVVGGTGSLATGTAVLTLNAAQDALSYSITLIGLDLDGLQTPMDATDNVTAMHFHAAPAGSNGGVVFGLISPNHDVDDLVIDPVAGTLTGIWEETDVNPLSGQLPNLMVGNLYLNVHTTSFPGGEIRGQVLVAAPIPTLSQWGITVLVLMLLIFGAVALKTSRILNKAN